MSTHAAGNRPARDRLLDAASELFYGRGVHTVGIDAIIERAAVAKATLYSAFGSKEELVRAYLEARHASRRATLLAEMELHDDDPRRKLLALFDVLAAVPSPTPPPSPGPTPRLPKSPARPARGCSR
jgi:AcrR family transcriptional regulator